MSGPEPPVLVAPVGPMDPRIPENVCLNVGRVFGCTTRIEPLDGDLDFAYDRERRQYLSTRILQSLAERTSDGVLKVVGIVTVDLFIPILTHVYGEAQMGGRACVVSTFRLREGLGGDGPEGAFQDRIAKEAIHELGHTFDLRHCPEPSCIMHYCRSTRDVDRKSDGLCRHCKVLLADGIRRLERAPDAGTR